MHWWQQQFQAWQEISFGVVMLVVGLYIEDRIDQWRFKRLSRTTRPKIRVKLK